jgi:hypothetical protein
MTCRKPGHPICADVADLCSGRVNLPGNRAFLDGPFNLRADEANRVYGVTFQKLKKANNHVLCLYSKITKPAAGVVSRTTIRSPIFSTVSPCPTCSGSLEYMQCN